jgi:alkanesulfonate monooxygenase SsuD/methylene tetrahydromethanopterin reductase-like flavin-dependent oxidoreductase (luciferase family)
MWPGPVSQAVYDLYVETWHKHKEDPIRLDAANAEPRVGCVLPIAIAPTEEEALDVARRGMEGLMRRTQNVHKHDPRVLPEDECEAAQEPLRRILAHVEPATIAGAGTAEQIAERLAAILEPGLTDLIVLQLPTGDMTLAEARRTLDLFVTEVKPQLEKIELAA